MCDRKRLEDMPDFLTIEEAGKILRLGRNASYSAAARGDFLTIRIGRRLIVPKQGLIKLMSGQDNS